MLFTPDVGQKGRKLQKKPETGVEEERQQGLEETGRAEQSKHDHKTVVPDPHQAHQLCCRALVQQESVKPWFSSLAMCANELSKEDAEAFSHLRPEGSVTYLQ